VPALFRYQRPVGQRNALLSEVFGDGSGTMVIGG
jgi:hypothetical protein